MRRILVPIDFSPPALRALAYAIALAKPLRAEVTACFVVEPIYYAVPDMAGEGVALQALMADQRRHALAQMTRLEQRYARKGVRLATVVVTGLAAEAIAAMAKRLRAEFIVIATHGRTGVSRFLMGSVAERVVRMAPCPVLTVRANLNSRRRAGGGRRKMAAA